MRVTKQDLVLGALRDLIAEGEYRPDCRLYVDEIASRLSVSQTPVREALRQLEAEGLVTSLPHHGWVVARPTFDQVRQIFLIRRALECLVAELASAKFTLGTLAELASIQTSALEAVAQLDFKQIRFHNKRFHDLIYRTANAPLLVETLRSVWSRLPYDLVAVLRSLPEDSSHEHDTLYAAFKSGNAAVAVSAMHDHIQSMLDAYTRWARAAGIDRSDGEPADGLAVGIEP